MNKDDKWWFEAMTDTGKDEGYFIRRNGKSPESLTWFGQLQYCLALIILSYEGL